MSENNLLEVLECIFRHSSELEPGMPFNKKKFLFKLEQYGFSKAALEHAFSWLKDLVKQQLYFEAKLVHCDAVRLFTQYETSKINTNCRNTILTLEKIGILDVKSREIVIQQLLQINKKNVDLDELKWVVFIVLLSNPDQVNLNEKINKLSLTLLSIKHEC